MCRGCKRYSHEIIQWNSYRDQQKTAILKRLESLLAQVVKSKVRITDESLLRRQIELQGIRFDADSDAHCWIFALLKAGAKQIDRLEDYGLSLYPEYVEMPLAELRDIIDQDFYVLSSVHYQRYFQ